MNNQTETDVLKAQVKALSEENARLKKWYAEAVQDIEDWATYASDYFKEKWDLKGDLKLHRDRLNGQLLTNKE